MFSGQLYRIVQGSKCKCGKVVNEVVVVNCG